MGKCSYAWNEWDEEKNELIRKSCQNEAWKGSDEFCILHDPASEKDVGLFKEMIEKQIESEKERHYFNGYCFPENWDFFVGRKLKIAADFRGATFQGTADFWGATFQDTNFKGATFQSTADFWEATFQDANFEGVTFQDANFRGATFQKADFIGATFQGASFVEATFQGTADFWGATFQGTADFWGATFEKKLEFAPEKVKRIDFKDVEFLFRSKVTTNLKEALFQGAFIENVAFIDCRWPEDYIMYEEKHMEDKEIGLSFDQLETIYRNLKQNMQNHGDYVRAGEFYYREMEMRRKGTSKREHLWLSLYKAIAGYGERPQNTALVSGSIVFLFALLYGALNCLHYSVENPSLQQKIIDVIYFSFVTFTTLGLGDIAPVTTLGKALICFEAVIGAFMIAVFVVVFVRKMAR